MARSTPKSQRRARTDASSTLSTSMQEMPSATSGIWPMTHSQRRAEARVISRIVSAGMTCTEGPSSGLRPMATSRPSAARYSSCAPAAMRCGSASGDEYDSHTCRTDDRPKSAATDA
jgi:hypothetical protein